VSDHDAGAVAEERAQELAALTQVQGDLAEVDRALAALDEGTYGTCQVCGEPIADEALAASPVARTCGAHDGAADDAPAPAGPAPVGPPGAPA
jgi:RNA polymerase-binding transcription factor DksA